MITTRREHIPDHNLAGYEWVIGMQGQTTGWMGHSSNAVPVASLLLQGA
jgi:hypothetical protein